MNQSLLDSTKDSFNTFRVESIWLRSIYDTSIALFSSGKETDDLLRRVAPLFFCDLNHIIVEYWVLVVCRLTDPAQTGKRENLTAKNLLESLSKLGLLTDEIQAEAAELQKYRDLLNDARNRVVSHADKETFLNPALLGAHSESQISGFLKHLQIFNDLVGQALGEGPLDFCGTSAPGDVYDLLHALRNVHQYE
jgi:hypothetical protein